MTRIPLDSRFTMEPGDLSYPQQFTISGDES